MTPRWGVTHKDGLTPLHYAAFGNARATAELLLDRGADANVTTANGWTPLHEAAKKNARETADLLLDHGAQGRRDPRRWLDAAARSRFEQVSRDGRTATGPWLPTFMRGSHPAQRRCISRRRPTPGESRSCSSTAVPTSTPRQTTARHHFTMQRKKTPTRRPKLLLLAGAADIDVTYPNGATLLHHAARETTLDTARLLLKRGANVNAKDADDNAPLAYAATRVMAEYLVEHGADINAMEDLSL